MYSLLDGLLAPTRAYSAHPRVYVISDSKYKDAQDNQNTELVAHIENVRADWLDSINKVAAQIAELRPSPPATNKLIARGKQAELVAWSPNLTH